MTVTVTAYADENTSKPVGSSSRTVQVEGTVDEPLVVTIAVEKAPHVDEDGGCLHPLSEVLTADDTDELDCSRASDWPWDRVDRCGR